MKSKPSWIIAYWIFGFCICLWFGVAAARGWKAPNLGLLDGSSSGGRSYGGSWGGGK